MSLTIEKALEQPIIRSVFRDEAGQIGFSVIRIIASRFLNSFGFSKKIDSSTIDNLTVDVLEKFSFETLDDVLIFFKMCRQGEFGTTSRGVDSNLIFGEWFQKYLELKSIAREKSNKNTSHNESRSATDADVEYTYKKIQRAKKERDISDFVDETTKNMDRQMLEDTITEWGKHDVYKNYIHLLKLKRKTIK